MTTEANQKMYLEVDKSNGAIMSYTFHPRESAKFHFVEVTQEELTHLNTLEDEVFAAGVITTLSDLLAYRAAKAQATANMAAKPVASVSKAPATKAAPAKKDASKRKPMTSLELKKGFKPVTKSKK